MGRKTRILRRVNKFGLKYASHPRIRNNGKESDIVSSLIEDLPIQIKEEVLEPEIEPIIEQIIEVKKTTPPKKESKPKK